MINKLLLLLLMTSQMSFSMSWFFGTKSKKTSSDWADFKEHIHNRKQQGWKTEENELKAVSKDFTKNITSTPYGNEQFKTNTSVASNVKGLLNYLPQKYKKLTTEEDRENFFITFDNYITNDETIKLDKKTQTTLDLLNNVSEMLYAESDAKRSRVDQLNIIKSELDNILIKLEQNPSNMLLYCIKSNLLLKQKALIKQMKNEHAKDRTMYFDVSELTDEPVKLDKQTKTKLKPLRYNSLRELPLSDDHESSDAHKVRPKLLKRTESQRIQDFVSKFITDANNDLISIEHLQLMYPKLEIDNEGAGQIGVLNQLFSLELIAKKSILEALGSIIKELNAKTNPKKLKKHVRNIPSGAVWLDTMRLAKFSEERETAEKKQELLQQQRDNGNYSNVVFKANDKFGQQTSTNNTNAKK